MELTDLQECWASLNERLEKQEIIKIKFLKEILQTKANGALGKLYLMEYIGAIVLPLIILFLFVLKKIIKYPDSQTYLIYGLTILCIILEIWQILKIRLISGINLTSDIKRNIKCIEKFKIMILKEKFYSLRIVLPLVLAGIILT